MMKPCRSVWFSVRATCASHFGIVKQKKGGVYRTDPQSHDCLIITGEGGEQSSKSPGSGLLKTRLGSNAARAVPTN